MVIVSITSKEKMEKRSVFTSIALCFAAALLSFGALYLGYFSFPKLKQNNIIAVKGLVEREVEADLAIVKICVDAEDDDVAKLAKTLGEYREEAKNIIKKHDVGGDIVDDKRSITKDSRETYENGNRTGTKTVYTGSYMIKLRVKQLDKIKQVLSDFEKLMESGIFVRKWVAYKYTKFQEVKEEMMQEAVANARNVADVVAKKAGVYVRDLISMKQGYISVTARDESDSEEGCYALAENERASKIKKLRLIVNAEFEISPVQVEK